MLDSGVGFLVRNLGEGGFLKQGIFPGSGKFATFDFGPNSGVQNVKCAVGISFL